MTNSDYNACLIDKDACPKWCYATGGVIGIYNLFTLCKHLILLCNSKSFTLQLSR